MMIIISINPITVNGLFCEDRIYFLGEFALIKGSMIISIGGLQLSYKNIEIICDCIEIINTLKCFVDTDEIYSSLNFYDDSELKISREEKGGYRFFHYKTNSWSKIISYEEILDFCECLSQIILEWISEYIPNGYKSALNLLV